MDILRKLTIEVQGICGAITEYTGEPFITNITTELIRSVEEKNLEDIKYLLEQVSVWYGKNQSQIQTNQFVHNKDVHLDIESRIRNYLIELEKINSKGEPKKAMKKIFISHSSSDKEICNLFVNLLEGIGIPEEFILYTSSPRHGIPGDEDIFKYLRQYLSDGITVYYMLSDNYYQSAYCLNEMGAAWVVQNDFSTFLLPNFSGDIKGVIDKNKKAYTLAEPVELIQFKNKLTKTFGLKISEEKWEDTKNSFIKSLSK